MPHRRSRCRSSRRSRPAASGPFGSFSGGIDHRRVFQPQHRAVLLPREGDEVQVHEPDVGQRRGVVGGAAGGGGHPGREAAQAEVLAVGAGHARQGLQGRAVEAGQGGGIVGGVGRTGPPRGWPASRRTPGRAPFPPSGRRRRRSGCGWRPAAACRCHRGRAWCPRSARAACRPSTPPRPGRRRWCRTLAASPSRRRRRRGSPGSGPVAQADSRASRSSGSHREPTGRTGIVMGVSWTGRCRIPQLCARNAAGVIAGRVAPPRRTPDP